MSDEDPQPLEVIPIHGERLVFWVRSESNPKRKYRVDLLSHGGRSECSCPDWRVRSWVFIRDGAPITNSSIFCKHVDVCRRHVINSVLMDLAAKEQSPDEQHPNA